MIYHTHNEGSETEAQRYHLRDLDATVRYARDLLRDRADSFDTIVVTGTSGVLVGSPLSLLLHKELTVVRKPNDGSHQAMWYGGMKGQIIGASGIGPGKRILFVDDTIASGDTLERVRQAVEHEGGKIVAWYLYENHTYDEGRPST